MKIEFRKLSWIENIKNSTYQKLWDAGKMYIGWSLYVQLRKKIKVKNP